MIRIFRSTDIGIQETTEAVPGSWVALTNPTFEELEHVSKHFEIDLDDLKSALDEEERSRIQVEDNYTLIILDIPALESHDNRENFYTLPFGIIYTEKLIFTVCLIDTPVLSVFMDGRVRDFYTYEKTRFLYQMLYHNATLYLKYLRIIDKQSEAVESQLHISQRNEELLQMQVLEKSLVYFSTSLRGNEVVIERLMRNKTIPSTEEEKELLEDVIVENKQAIEMAKLYSDILAGTMEIFASVISNNLNIVMKFLSIITIVLTVPTIITGAFGMNVGGIPFGHHPHGFLLVSIIILGLTLLTGILIGKSRWMD